MDVDDPIHQFLKTTGWSCDDLLEKLQKYKCQKEPNKEDSTNPPDKVSADPKECITVSTNEGSAHPKECITVTTDEGSAGPEGCITVTTDEGSASPKECITVSTDEVNNYDISKVQNLELREFDKISNINNEKADTVFNSHVVNEEFSDTDEDENEVNTTHSNIINEIIDEISTGEAEGSKDKNDNLDYQTTINRDDETTEVTEVRVIQVNSDDDEDDLFTEEVCQNTKNSDEILNSNKFEYLETYPRNVSTINESNCNEKTKADEERINISQETDRAQPLIGEKQADQDYELESREYDKSVVLTVDEISDSGLTKIKSIAEKITDFIDLDTTTSNETSIQDAEKEFSSKYLKSVLHNISRIRTNLLKTHNETNTDIETDLPDVCNEKINLENPNKDAGEECTSENLENTENNLKLQLNRLNVNKETKAASEEKLNNSDLVIKSNNASLEKKSASENLEETQNNSKLQSNTHKHKKFNTDKNIDSLHLGIERNNESHEVEEQSTSNNFEDIRNNLKLQLNSLRTRKKGHFLQNLRNNVTNVNYNKKTLNNPDKDDNNRTSVENVEKSTKVIQELEKKEVSTNSEDDNLDDKLYTQTNEFGLVILNVQGGIDIDEIEGKSGENHYTVDNLNENCSYTNHSVLETGTDFNDTNSFCQDNAETDDREIDSSNGVLDEIRKIIRKQKVNTFKKNKKTEVNSKIDTYKTNIDNFGFFSCSSEFEATEEKISGCAKNRSTDMSAENSSSSLTVDDTSQAVAKNSPFVSNTLDEFLTENSKLNISYNVPKCGAEDGLSESYHDQSPLLLKKVVNANKESSNPKKIKTIKAKTLAQKRKMLEKQRLKQMKSLKPASIQSNSNIVKLENTEAIQEKNDSFVMVNDEKIWVKTVTPSSCIAKIITKKTVPSMVSKINQPVKKLSLLTDLGKKVKEQIKYRPGPMCKKAELQISGQDNWMTEMKILPKIILEVTPKIGEPISPSILNRLPQCDGQLTESRIEFALSVLKTKCESDVEQKTFKFPVPYKENQQKVFVRKQKISPTKYNITKFGYEDTNVENVVGNVIDRLITYVETTEMAPSLIKEEEEIKWDTVADDKFTNMPLIADNVSSIFKKPQKKRSRVELELSRLSCKVVNVEVEENLTQEICYKPYCQLGCVCNSLKCDRILTYHCGKVQCMLDCTCPKERALVYDKVTLPAGTDILSTDAVSRIEDEAKKDLAKVEREFTQTVIHTNDKTIVVGLGGRNKSRRTTKIPKKYSDYVDSFEVKDEEKDKAIDKNDFFRKCVVNLENLNLSDIIPYCLTHYLYDCHCKGQSLYLSNYAVTKLNTSQSEPIVIEDDEEISNKNNIQCKPGLEKSNNDSGGAPGDKQNTTPKKYTKTSLLKSASDPLDVNIEEAVENIADLKKYSKTRLLKPAEKQIAKPKKSGKNKTLLLKPVFEIIDNKASTLKKSTKVVKEDHKQSDEIESTETKSSNGRPIRNIKRVKLRDDFSYSTYFPDDCARVRGIPLQVVKNYKINSKSKIGFQKNDFINNITEADLLKSKINFNLDTRQMLEVDLLKQQLINELNRQRKALALLLENTYCDKSKHKRKQTLEIRNDENNSKVSFNQAIQRRKKLALVGQKNTLIEPVFDGEIIIDSRNMELLEKMGTRTVSDGYARLLPWKALTESYRNGSIKIWSMVDTPSRLLINKSDKVPPKNYINITQVTATTEVIMWILRNKLPSSYHEDHVSFILKQTKDHYEICGLCTKNFSEDVLANEAANNNGSESESVVEQAEESPKSFPHKDLNGITQMLYIKKEKFKLQELIEENMAAVGETSIDKSRLYMWASLPEILRAGKWRIIFLNSDFTYLYFTKLKYSIKYTDLIGMGKMAKSGKCTIMLRNPLLQQEYKHERFGIYFDSHYVDRIFIGPYSKDFDLEDIETLRYINKSLVSNEAFHKMIGKMNYKCGHWLIERPYGRTKRQSEQTIDLTHDSYHTPNKRKGDSITDESIKRPKIEEHKTKDCPIIMHKKDQIKVIDSAPRKPEDFNRYLITNIPYFGYLGAYKHDDSHEIDVSWPFENKLLRFPTVNSAIDFLQERFSSLLQPIPESFKISVIVLKKIDLLNSQPVNASVLRGHYICGEFGFYNVKHISDNICQSVVGMTREELLRIFAKRAQTFVRNKIEELADLLHIEKSELGRYDIIHILDMAQKEIDRLKEIEKSDIAKKNELALQKRELALKVFCMISTLPEKQQRWEHLKFRKTLGRGTSTSFNKTEPIVIPDSDEEENVSNNDSKDSLSYEETSEILVNSNLDLYSTGSNSISSLASEMDKVNAQDGRMVSVLNKNISAKVTETGLLIPPRRQLRLKSVLKPISKTAFSEVKPSCSLSKEYNINLTENTTTAMSAVTFSSSFSKEPEANSTENDALQKMPSSKCSKPQYLTGVKIVKTSSGKFVLVNDNQNEAKPFRLPDAIKGTKIIIKNNKILSVKRMENDNSGCEQDTCASDPPSKKVKVTSTQVHSSPILTRRSILATSSSTNDNSPQLYLEENEYIEKNISVESSKELSVQKVEADNNSCEQIFSASAPPDLILLGSPNKDILASKSILATTSSANGGISQPRLEENEYIEKNMAVDFSEELSVRKIEADNSGCEQIISASDPPDLILPGSPNKNVLANRSILATSSSIRDFSTQQLKNVAIETNKKLSVRKIETNIGCEKDISSDPPVKKTKVTSTRACLLNKNILANKSILATTNLTNDSSIQLCLEENEGTDKNMAAVSCKELSVTNTEADNSGCDLDISASDPLPQKVMTQPSLEENERIEEKNTADESINELSVRNIEADNSGCEQDISGSDPPSKEVKVTSIQVRRSSDKNIPASKSILATTSSISDISTQQLKNLAIETNKKLSVRKIETNIGCEKDISASDPPVKKTKMITTRARSLRNKNILANKSILATTSSTNDSSTQLCLEENEGTDKNMAVVSRKELSVTKTEADNSGCDISASDPLSLKVMTQPNLEENERIEEKNTAGESIKELSVRNIEADNSGCEQDISGSDPLSKEVKVTSIQVRRSSDKNIPAGKSILATTNSISDISTQLLKNLAIETNKKLSIRKIETNIACEKDISASDPPVKKTKVTSTRACSNKNILANKRILATTSSTNDSSTQLCLEENEGTDKNMAAVSCKELTVTKTEADNSGCDLDISASDPLPQKVMTQPSIEENERIEEQNTAGESIKELSVRNIEADNSGCEQDISDSDPPPEEVKVTSIQGRRSSDKNIPASKSILGTTSLKNNTSTKLCLEDNSLKKNMNVDSSKELLFTRAEADNSGCEQGTSASDPPSKKLKVTSIQVRRSADNNAPAGRGILAATSSINDTSTKLCLEDNSIEKKKVPKSMKELLSVVKIEPKNRGSAQSIPVSDPLSKRVKVTSIQVRRSRDKKGLVGRSVLATTNSTKNYSTKIYLNKNSIEKNNAADSSKELLPSNNSGLEQVIVASDPPSKRVKVTSIQVRRSPDKNLPEGRSIMATTSPTNTSKIEADNTSPKQSISASDPCSKKVKVTSIQVRHSPDKNIPADRSFLATTSFTSNTSKIEADISSGHDQGISAFDPPSKKVKLTSIQEHSLPDENVLASRSILATTSSTIDTSSQPCLEENEKIDKDLANKELSVQKIDANNEGCERGISAYGSPSSKVNVTSIQIGSSPNKNFNSSRSILRTTSSSDSSTQWCLESIENNVVAQSGELNVIANSVVNDVS